VLFGEPPATIHPVVWMGRVLDWLRVRGDRGEPALLVYGLVVAVVVPAFWGAAGVLVERWAPWPAQALALKAAFSGRALFAAGQRVEDALIQDDLDRARKELAWLVSRPRSSLPPEQVAGAAIESLAENLVDSWLAPLLAHALFGMGGAYAYRAVNTADAMWGYRTQEYEWLGKAAARVDDLLNWLPARVAAALLISTGPRPAAAFAAWRADAAQTASPNAGQSMAAAAGQLGVRLEKPGHYVLNGAARPPTAADIAAARALVARAAALGLLLAMVLRRVIR
jgi:adenosylcobinamide-phosphate synthase